METLAHPRRHRSGPALRWQAWFTFQRRMRKAPALLCSIFSISFIFHRSRRLSVSLSALVLFPLVVVVVVVCPSSFLGRGTTMTRAMPSRTSDSISPDSFVRPALSHRFFFFGNIHADFESILQENLTCSINCASNKQSFFFYKKSVAFSTEETKLFCFCREICLIFCHRIVTDFRALENVRCRMWQQSIKVFW